MNRKQAKPWDTNGIEGVHRFLKKFWRLFDSALESPAEGEPSAEEMKVLHQTIKRVTDDVERFSFNTVVSTFMICANQLGELRCRHLEVLEPLAVLIAPLAPHIAEELWHRLGHDGSVCDARWPQFDGRWLVESKVKYPVQFNGKMRFTVELAADCTQQQALDIIKSMPEGQKWLGGAEPKKVIFVPKKIINIVC